jgi:tetratricopeptide (TPR) repeat protein
MLASAVYAESTNPTRKARELLELGQMLEFNGNPKAAQAAYEQSVNLDGSVKETHQMLARLYAAEHQYDQALSQLQAVIEKVPKDLPAQIEMAALLRKIGRSKEAVRSLEMARTIPHKDAAVERELGFSLLEAGENTKAEELFLSLSEQQPKVVDYYLGLAVSEFRLGKVELANCSIRKVLELNPDEPNAHCLLGDLDFSRGKRDEAVADYRKSISLQPTLAQPYISLGNLYLRAGELAQAHKVFEEAQNNCPIQADILLGLAVVLEKQNDLTEAIQLLEQAADVETDSEQARNIREHITSLKLSRKSNN